MESAVNMKDISMERINMENYSSKSIKYERPQKPQFNSVQHASDSEGENFRNIVPGQPISNKPVLHRHQKPPLSGQSPLKQGALQMIQEDNQESIYALANPQRVLLPKRKQLEKETKGNKSALDMSANDSISNVKGMGPHQGLYPKRPVLNQSKSQTPSRQIASQGQKNYIKENMYNVIFEQR